ncbi:MAG: ECF transporter S component, partial [Aeromicrobium sp.]
MTTSVHPSKVRELFAYRTIDLITLTTLGVAFGVVFWGWDKLYPHINLAAVISYPPATGLLVGPWLIAGIVGGLVIRKPGAALA